MPFVKTLSIDHKDRPYFPWSIPSCRLCESITLDGNVTFLTGDNGVGKSTLLESLALKLKDLNVLTLMPPLKDSEAAQTVMPSLEVNLVRQPLQAHLIRAEDLGRKIEKYYAHVDDWAKKMELEEDIDEFRTKGVRFFETESFGFQRT
jgi:predicted ATPase